MLSDQQKEVLRECLQREQRGDGTWLYGRRQEESRSESASRSRAIRRLEARGLVERCNYLTGAWGSDVGRTTDLLLTEPGRAMARALG